MVGYVGRQAEKHPKVDQNVTFFHCENGTFYRKSNERGKADCSCSNLELISKRLSSGLSRQACSGGCIPNDPQAATRHELEQFSINESLDSISNCSIFLSQCIYYMFLLSFSIFSETSSHNL